MNAVYLQLYSIIRVIKQMSISRTAPATLTRIALSLMLAASLSACSMFSSSDKQKDETEGLSAEAIYQKAQAAVKATDYQQAIKLYESLEARKSATIASASSRVITPSLTNLSAY